MASLYLLKSTSSPISVSQSDFPAKSNCRKTVIRLKSYSSFSWRRCVRRPNLRISCSVREEDNQTNGDEPPESLFMKELKRRGMNPTQLLEESTKSSYGAGDEMKIGEEARDFFKRNTVSTGFDQSLSNQRERSMALNSEGLEGLIPRAKLLLTLGGTFFLAFWPLILSTVGFFSAVYLYFGSDFVHDGTDVAKSLPQYVDPYELLEDERISQIAPSLK
ncbi:uncharacterized protein [Euphorbia lathyris]|uniref:uncharacterized protein n=1 Tax=Euphorbia lathyris TaxID=212925 RepID=UPI0033142524